MKTMIYILLASQISIAQVKTTMQDLFVVTEKLNPYVIDKKEYLNAKNEKQISVLLADFKIKTALLKKQHAAQSDDMKFRLEQLDRRLDEAEKNFNGGLKDYSYWLVKASLNNCYSCHTEKALTGTSYTFDQKSKYDAFTQAEFLFLVRNYTAAIPLYVEILTTYPRKNISVETLESSAQKLLFYAVRVARDDAKTVSLFDKVLANGELPAGLNTNILAWKKYLSHKKQHVNLDLKIKTKTDLERFMNSRENIAKDYPSLRQRLAVDLDTSRFLHNLLQTSNDVDLKPWLLYWVSSVEKNDRSDMFDQTTENYLQECIEKYSRHPAAKKCFTLYRDLILKSFTASRGTIVPQDVQDLLKKYETLVIQ